MRAIPSPTWRTVPTSARSVSTSNSSIRCFRIEVISSGRSFTRTPLSNCCQLSLQALEPAAHARVEPVRADLEDDSADQARVDGARRLDLAAGRLLDLRQQALRLVVRKLDRGRQLCVDDSFVLCDQALELARDVVEDARAAPVRQQEDEIAHEGLAAAEHVLEDRRLGTRVELRISQELSQLRHLLDSLRQLGDLGADRLELVRIERRAEERACVHAVDDCHSLASRTEKSSSPTASSISRRWSASSSDFRVTFSAATRLSSATSVRIRSSARRVSASICLRVSSSRRCRSVSVSSRIRRSFASATLRASTRMPSASFFAWPISLRCSSSSFRASSRA